MEEKTPSLAAPDTEPVINQLKKTIAESAKKGLNNLKQLKFYQSFIKEYGVELIVLPILFATLMWYFIYKFNKVNRALADMIPLEENLTGLVSLNRSEQIMGESKDFRLCDFWIAGSFKTYLAKGYREEVHVNIIKQTLKLGCRFVDLDLYVIPGKGKNKDDAEIVIANGDPFNKLIYSATMSFEDTIKTLSEVAFSPRLRNGDDPLFLNLNMDALRDDDEAQTKVAAIIRKYLGNVLLDDKYNYQGRMGDPRHSVALMPIKELVSRHSCVIMTSSDVRDKPMDILVNLCPTTMANISYKSYSDVLGISLDDLKKINRSTITVLQPDYSGPSSSRKNYNWVQGLVAGCQFICLSYNQGQQSEPLRSLLDFFKTYSMVVKPYQMRYRPITIEKPLEQNKELSMTSKIVNTPDGVVTI